MQRLKTLELAGPQGEPAPELCGASGVIFWKVISRRR